jgi:hypothetical protein
VRAAPLISKQIVDCIRFLRTAEEKEREQNAGKDSKPEKKVS